MPWVSLLQLKQVGHLSTEVTADAAPLALQFLEIAHVDTATKRRKQVTSYLNKVPWPLVKDVDRFETAVLHLFRKEHQGTCGLN